MITTNVIDAIVLALESIDVNYVKLSQKDYSNVRANGSLVKKFSEEKILERPFAYEFYHQFRNLMEKGIVDLGDLIIQAEIDKTYQHCFKSNKEPTGRGRIPDFLVHLPDSENNLAVIEFKLTSNLDNLVRDFQKLESELYFQEATGYECVDSGVIRGIWGSDIEAFFYLQLRMHDIWPIPEKIDSYDEPTLFTIVEFLYDYVSEPQEKRYHKWDDCGWHGSDFDRDKGKERYRKEMNDILKDYDSGYKLANTGEILNISPTGLETLSEETVETGDSENIDNRIQTAIIKYKKYNATLDDKKDAIRVLADVLEYLKS